MSEVLASNSDEMRQCLHRALLSLSPEAKALLSSYIEAQFDAEQGAFIGRDGQPDLYYTSFGLSCAETLGMKAQIPISRVMRYLSRQSVQSLDFIHQACWVKDVMLALQLKRQCSVFTIKQLSLQMKQKLVKEYMSKLSLVQQPDFLQDPYMMYLALNLWQDMGLRFDVETRDACLKALDSCRAADGCSYSKGSGEQSGVLPTTVAAILVRRQLSGVVDHKALTWLAQQQRDEGGFAASDGTPLPDMLSTAVALFTLRLCGELQPQQAACAKGFIQDHWLPSGGFSSLIDDETSDCEYTFYGLLALGSLAV